MIPLKLKSYENVKGDHAKQASRTRGKVASPPLYVKKAFGIGSKWKFLHYKVEEHLLFLTYCPPPILATLGKTLLTPLGAKEALLIYMST